MLKKSTVIVLLISFISVNLFAQEIVVVPMSTKNISYKAKIYSSDFNLVQTKKKNVCKEFLDIKLLKQNKYYAKHYIAKNRPLCKKNVFIPQNKRIKFKFGNVEIERDGEIIKETSRYIKIKNLDGTIDKIFKDGINR